VTPRVLQFLACCLIVGGTLPPWARSQPAGVGSALAQPRLPELQHFNLRLFEIPYDWTGGTRPSAATSVKLYVSADQGVSWQEISSARAEVQYFRYHAPSDGEYWFAIRTIDKSGRARPEGPLAPEQRMLVDTRNPEITSLQAIRTSPQRIDVRWEAVDQYIDPASLVAEYRTATTDWTPMKILGTLQSTPGAVTGEASCEIDPSVTSAWVRVTVRDKAGNGRQAGAEVRAAGAIPATQVALPTTSLPSATLPPVAAAPRVNWTPGPAGPTTAPAATQLWPSDGATTIPFATTSSPAPTSQPSPYYPVTPEPAPFNPQSLAHTPLPSVGPPPADLPGDERRVPTQFASTQFGVPPEFAPLGPPLSQGVAPHVMPTASQASPPTQYLNQLQLDFDYNIQAIGAAGVARVELWATSDGGQQWQRLAIDNDNRSPIQVQLPQPGRYGLRIVVQPVGGFEVPGPQPGDKPEMTIEVDTTPPVAQLTGVQQGVGFHADHLLIKWQASDVNLPSHAATLRYSTRPEGPWQTIASDLTSSGDYAWRLARHVPTQFYLQLEVTDLAGNRTLHQTAVPVTVVLPEASGQLEQARPAGQ
jgi:hypothetical protein